MLTNSFQLLDEAQLEFLKETVQKIGVPKVLSGKWQWRESEFQINTHLNLSGQFSSLTRFKCRTQDLWGRGEL